MGQVTLEVFLALSEKVALVEMQTKNVDFSCKILTVNSSGTQEDFVPLLVREYSSSAIAP